MQSADFSVFTHKYQSLFFFFDLTVVDRAALFSMTQVWETQHHHSGESLLLSEHRAGDAAMFHRLFEGFEGETVPGVGMQCQSNGDCTGFSLTTKMKKKREKKDKICPNSWSAREKKKQHGLRDSFFFTRLVLRSMFFLFSTHEGLMSSFLKCSYD